MDPVQLKNLIITVLKAFGKYSAEVVDLLMLTAAQESHCGKFIYQIGTGPARGIFQMEPDTLRDIYNNYLSFRGDLKNLVDSFKSSQTDPEIDLTGNIIYQIVMARVHYLRKKEPLPKRGGLQETDYVYAMAEYWKKHWNTEKGDGKVQEAVDNYNKYVRGVKE